MTSKLVSRWQTPEGIALAWKVREALGKDQSLGGLGLEPVDGRWDLRGFRDPVGEAHEVSVPVPGTERTVQVALRRPELVIIGRPGPLDLSGASLRAVKVRGAVLESCLFDRADWRDASISQAACVANCSLRACHFSNAYPGLDDFDTKPVRFLKVDFSGSRFNRTMAANAEFHGCLFRDVRMFRAEFDGLMTDCTFSGFSSLALQSSRRRPFQHP